MEFSKFIEWAFYGIVSGSVVYGVTLLSKLHNDLKNLSIQFERVLAANAWHEKELLRHDKEIQRLWDLSDRN